jgi:ribosomal protein L19
MGNPKFLLALIIVFLVTGCSNGIENEEQKIVVQNLVGYYESKPLEGKVDLYEVTEDKKVLKVKEILDETDWENAKVNMVRPPDYKFHFEYINKDIESNTVQHSVWISPNKDKLEIVRGNDEYAQLTKENSAILFEIITGDNLSDLKANMEKEDDSKLQEFEGYIVEKKVEENGANRILVIQNITPNEIENKTNEELLIQSRDNRTGSYFT